MNYFFHPEAAEELTEGVEYYENCAPGLGYDFSIEVHSAIKRICSFPKAWMRLEGVRQIGFLLVFYILKKRHPLLFLQ